MLLPVPNPDHWRILTQATIALRMSMPWSGSMQRQLWHAQARPFIGPNLIVASDYGGEHRSATHRVYAFLVCQGISRGWFNGMQRVRREFLTDGRRMSFKRVGDPRRMAALETYLQAADTLTGHLVVIAVDKRIKRLAGPANAAGRFREAFRLRARWNDQSLEDLARKAYFLTICLSLWASPGMNLVWVSDQDQSVANDQRLDDLQRVVARLSSVYLQFPMGEFAIDTTASDDHERHWEDLCAIPDLAAGMVSDISASIMRSGGISSTGPAKIDTLSEKSSVISEWFWWPFYNLKRTLLSFDQGPQSKISLQTINMVYQT